MYILFDRKCNMVVMMYVVSLSIGLNSQSMCMNECGKMTLLGWSISILFFMCQCCESIWFFISRIISWASNWDWISNKFALTRIDLQWVSHLRFFQEALYKYLLCWFLIWCIHKDKWHNDLFEVTWRMMSFSFSMFMISNETVNIWSHLLGAGWFFHLTIDLNYRLLPGMNKVQTIDHLVMSFFCLCFLVSFSFLIFILIHLKPMFSRTGTALLVHPLMCLFVVSLLYSA